MLRAYIKSLRYLIVALGAVVIYAVVNALVLFGIADSIDYALTGYGELFVSEIKLVVIYALLLIPIGNIVAKLKGRYKQKAHMELRSYYVDKLFDKDISEIQKENTATYISNMTNDFSLLEMNLVENVYEVGRVLIEFLIGMWVISSVSPWVLVIAIGLILVNILLMRLCNQLVSKKIEQRSKLFDTYTVYIKEVLGAFSVIKSNNLERRVHQNFYKKSLDVQQKGYEIDKSFSYILAIQNVMAQSVYIIIILIGAYMVLIDQTTFGGMILILEGLGRVMWPMQQMFETLPKILTIKSLVNKLEKTLLVESSIKGSIRLQHFTKSIELRNLSFAYEDTNVLEDINLTIEKGKKYLIVGPSGKGKSTLLKLLRKYIKADKGEIYIDGNPLDEITSESYFDHVASIEQNVFIFEDTLRNNLTLYKEYSEYAINEVIDKAGLRSFVDNLPEGLDTMCYQNGKNLSGGERSRIVIARGLLADASILLMDEAFAALDMDRAKAIEKSVLALDGLTVLNVSHVLFEETKDRYDQIIKVNNKGIEFI